MRCAAAVLVGIALVTVLNGLPLWLKRVGIVDPELHIQFTEKFGRDAAAKPLDLDWSEAALLLDRFYARNAWETAFKLSKDALIALVLLLSILCGIRVGWPRPGAGTVALTALIVGASIYSLFSMDWIIALSGARTWAWLGCALFGGWVLGLADRRLLPRLCLFVLLVQGLLVVPELIWGMQFYGGNLFGIAWGDRLIGTFNVPASFGVASAFFGGICAGHARNARSAGLSVLGVLPLVLLSGSATAVLAWCAMLALTGYGRVPEGMRRSIRISVMLTLPILLWLLPAILGRADLYDSLWGRVAQFEMSLARLDHWPERLLGSGLGYGSNAALQFTAGGLPFTPPESIPHPHLFLADSAILLVILQSGVVGLSLCGLILLQTFVRLPEARPALAALAVASLAINTFELFPMNILLGLLVAKAWTESAKAPAC